MASVNKVILIGNLGRDPEVRYTSSGDAVCNLSIATTFSWKNKDGERVEETEWHRVSLFKRLAEIAGEYLKKGKPVYIEGRLRTRKWQNKDGQDQYTTEIMAESMQLLGGRDEGEPKQERSAAPARDTRTQAERKRGSAPQGFDDMNDDIPFASSCAAFDMDSRHARRVRRGDCR